MKKKKSKNNYIIDIFMILLFIIIICYIFYIKDANKIPLWAVIFGIISSGYLAITGTIFLIKQIGDL